MKYRDARKLVMGDVVARKSDKKVFTVVSIEAYGQYKRCKINCALLPSLERSETLHISFYNEEVDFPEIEEESDISLV